MYCIWARSAKFKIPHFEPQPPNYNTAKISCFTVLPAFDAAGSCSTSSSHCCHPVILAIALYDGEEYDNSQKVRNVLSHFLQVVTTIIFELALDDKNSTTGTDASEKDCIVGCTVHYYIHTIADTNRSNTLSTIA